MGGYHEYTEVRSCEDVVHLYHLLWSATILNIVALFLGIITAAVLGGFKDMVRHFSTSLTHSAEEENNHRQGGCYSSVVGTLLISTLL